MVIISSQPLFLFLFLMVGFPPVRAGLRAGMGGKGVGSMETLSREISPLCGDSA